MNRSTSSKVEYQYTDGSAGHNRPTKMIYPNGRILRYDYRSGTQSSLLSPVGERSGERTTARPPWGPHPNPLPKGEGGNSPEFPFRKSSLIADG